MTAPTLDAIPNSLRPTSLGGLAVVLASALVSLASYGPLGARLRVRWSVGYHYGPEYAPTPAVLVAFPVAVAVLYAGSRLLARRLERTGEFDDGRIYYEAAVLATLLAVGLVQVALLAVNLLL